MPLIETRGAASAQGFGEFAQSAAVNYIEDVFSTYLYTGNQTARSIVNGIDLSTKGGMIWTKCRSAAGANAIYDTARGTTGQLNSGSTAAAGTATDAVTAYNTDGYSLGVDNVNGNVNNNGFTFVSWTFRKQKKFFDVVTYTGDGQNDRQISHNLGSTPGCIIVKSLYMTGAGGPANWSVYHRSISPSQSLFLNTTAAAATNDGLFGTPTSTYFVVNQPGGGNTLNANGDQYVAYLFAHDAGGFGLTGSDNVISCGSFTTDGSGNATVSLGYEPQYLLWKRTDSTSNWLVLDNMRGWTNGSTDSLLRPNVSDAESTGSDYGFPTATGFYMTNMVASATYIYIAIRRGPMKVPTSGTSVFSPNAFTTNNVKQTTGFPVDMLMGGYLAAGSNWASTVSRLQGLNTTTTSGSPYPRLVTSSNGAELSGTNVYYGYDNTGFISGGLTGSADNIAWSFRRAPGFFDVVCYTGTGSSQNITHNLGVAPELIICKARTDPGGLTPQWTVGFSFNSTNFSYAYLNLTAAATTPGSYTGQSTFSAQPTSTQFTVNTYAGVNQNGAAMIAYLFATVAGVSKVGTYTGSGTTKQIDCGFTGGARFVLIKRTDSTGDWYVYDTARGIVSGNDPYLLLNSTAAEVTNTDYVDTYSAGFELSSTAPAALNANGGTFVFLAIA